MNLNENLQRPSNLLWMARKLDTHRCVLITSSRDNANASNLKQRFIQTRNYHAIYNHVAPVAPFAVPR